MENDTAHREWVRLRANAVLSKYSAYRALLDQNITLLDEDTSLQILCPFHEDKNKPSSRYYAGSGRDKSHFYCFKCKIKLDGIGLFAKFQGIPWMSALEKLERKYDIKIPKPESQFVVQQKTQEKELDVLLDLLEKKLRRNRDKMSLLDFTKACRMIDAIIWDYNKLGRSNNNMINGAKNLMGFIDKHVNINYNLD